MQFLVHGHLLLLTHTSGTKGYPYKKSKLIKDMDNMDNKDNKDIEDIKDRNYLKPVS